MIARYYATANVRAPYVCVFGQMHPRSGIWRSCNSGVLLLSRQATETEIESVSACLRWTSGIRWPSASRMLCAEACEFGIQFGRALAATLRAHRTELQSLASRRCAKQKAKARRAGR